MNMTFQTQFEFVCPFRFYPTLAISHNIIICWFSKASTILPSEIVAQRFQDLFWTAPLSPNKQIRTFMRPLLNCYCHLAFVNLLRFDILGYTYIVYQTGCGAGADITCHSGPELERGHLRLESGANLRSTK